MPVWVFATIATVVAGLFLRFGRYGCAMFCACGALGAMLSLDVQDHHVVALQRRGVVAPFKQRARIEGEVRYVRVHGNHIRVVVDGHVDGSETECAHMRVVLSYVKRDSAIATPIVGEYLITYATVRLPLVKSLPTDVDEVALLRRHQALLVATAANVHVVAQALWYQRRLHDVRTWVRNRLCKTLSEDVVGVALAILIGDRSLIDAEDAQAYALSGTAHMFSVSGSHVALVVAVLMIASGGRARLWSLVMWSVVLMIYIAITGAEAPAVRAGIMGIAALIGRYLQRDVYALNLLCASVIVMIIISPMQIYDVGFQLSVLATGSLIVLPPLYNALWQRVSGRAEQIAWLRAVYRAAAFSAAATVGTAIPSMTSFTSVAVAGVIVNPVVIPMLSLAVLTSAALLLPLPVVVTQSFAWTTSMLVRGADTLAHLGAQAGIDSAPLHYRTALTLVLCTTLLWPLGSTTLLRILMRTSIGSAAIALLLVMRPAAASMPDKALFLREHGVVVYHRDTKTCMLYIVGETNAPRDAALLRWVSQLYPKPRVVGVGSWGRKMAGAIEHDTVGSGNGSIRHSRHGARGDRGGNSR